MFRLIAIPSRAPADAGRATDVRRHPHPARRRLPALVLMAAALALAGCGPSAEERQAAARAAAQAAQEREAAEQLAGYRQALAQDNIELAAAYGELIVGRYGNTQAARELGEQYADIRAKADALKQQRYLESLWSYQTAPMGGGTQRTASLYSANTSGPRLRLVLRNHTQWGQSAFLLPESDIFVCAKACRVSVRFDDGPAQAMAASKADSKENPGLFIEDRRAFVAGLEKAQTVVAIDVPVAGGSETFSFEVGGYDPKRFEAGR